MELTQMTKETHFDCIASVILYKNPPEMIENVISGFLDTTLKVKLYLIDNSPTPQSVAVENRPVFYHYVGQNLGYGRAHNWGIQRCEPCKYFLILNPDVIISKGVLEELSQYLNRNPEVGIVCPRVLNENQSLQYLNKLQPNLLDLFLRCLCMNSSKFMFIKKRLDQYEMRDVGYDHIHEVPFMTGAFMFCRTQVLKKIGGFDPRFFMYFEDADLSRKIQNAGYKTVYYPHVNITHLWQRESRKSLKMAFVFMISGMKYFNKWGWKLF